MKTVPKTIALLVTFLLIQAMCLDFGWDEKYEKQFKELSETDNWGRNVLRELTVNKWNKEKSYISIRKEIEKFVSKNKEKIVSATRLEEGGNDCEAGPKDYSSIWLIALNDGKVHVFKDQEKGETIHKIVDGRKQYWSIVINLEQIKTKKAVEIIDNSECTAVSVYFLSYYDKNQSYQLIYKVECGDDEIKDKTYLIAKKIVKEIESYCEKNK